MESTVQKAVDFSVFLRYFSKFRKYYQRLRKFEGKIASKLNIYCNYVCFYKKIEDGGNNSVGRFIKNSYL